MLTQDIANGSHRHRALAWWAAPLTALPALLPLARAYVDPNSQGKVVTG
jgi:hypothetical protein